MLAQNLISNLKKHDPVASDVENLKKAIQDIQIQIKKIQVNIFAAEQEHVDTIKATVQNEEDRLTTELEIKQKSQESQIKFITRVIQRAIKKQEKMVQSTQNEQKVDIQ